MSPRPNPGRTIDAENVMRANIDRWLEEHERSAAWLASKAGLPYAVLHKILRQGRQIRVDEAIAIADVLDVRVQDLVKASGGIITDPRPWAVRGCLAPHTAPLTAEQPSADHGDGSGAGGGAEGEGGK